MRIVEINGNDQLKIAESSQLIFCPFENGLCSTSCAWFRVKEQRRILCEEENAPSGKHHFRDYAFCGDKLIGELADVKKL